jgi:CO/xanthine dehydrogenase Mo-binding subunit
MPDPRVTGAARYSQDVRMEGMLHARLVRSPVAHARVVRVDASALPEGVVVLLPEDVRDLGGYGPQIKDQEVLPQERVRYAGDVVAAVAAETVEEAEEAQELIDVDYEELPAVFDEVKAASEGAPLVHETPPWSPTPHSPAGRGTVWRSRPARRRRSTCARTSPGSSALERRRSG